MSNRNNFMFIKSEHENYDECSDIIVASTGFVDVENVYNKLEEMVNLYGINTIIAKKEQIYYAARLLWNNDNIKRYILIDTDDAELNETQNIKATKLMWDGIAKRNMSSNDKIKLSGWIKSDTGEYFTYNEMEEFSDNLYQKVRNIIGEKSSVLEIGIASGFSCFAISPLVKMYYGVDISQQVLEFTARILKEENIHNVTLINCEAIDIDTAGLPKVDLVLMNSVIQYFPGYNYFINVLRKSIKILNHEGYIFLGDVLDLALYNEYTAFRRLKGSRHNREQYYSKEFFEKLPNYFGEIKEVIISEKIGKMTNELKQYRYDVLLKVDKNCTSLSRYKKYRLAENLLLDNENVSIRKIIKKIEKLQF